MKIVELVNYIQLPISNEEADVLAKFQDTSPIAKSELNIREQTVATQLVNKGVLIRKNSNGKVKYSKHING